MAWSILLLIIVAYALNIMIKSQQEAEALRFKIKQEEDRQNRIAEQIIYRNADSILFNLIDDEENRKPYIEGEYIAIYFVGRVLQERERELYKPISENIIFQSERIRVISSMLKRFKYFLNVNKMPSLMNAEETMRKVSKTPYTPRMEDEVKVLTKMVDNIVTHIINELNFYELLESSDGKEKYMNPLLKSQKQANDLIMLL